MDLSLASLQAQYASGELTPSTVMDTLLPLYNADPVAFIHRIPDEDILARCKDLEAVPSSSRPPLYGIPFAAKDNIDVAGCPTTAACPAYEYSPSTSAVAVQALLDAGAILVGKTNMDQFAAGLVGTRSPYGTPKNAFDDRFIPGGSSSGSAPLVASGLVTFALGTDTAGSGRVPAGLNGCVGIKPTVGKVSTAGVVPAARALDCVSCFARSVPEGAAIVRIMQTAGKLSDPTWRPQPPAPSIPVHVNGNGVHENGHSEPKFRFGMPGPELANFSGPSGSSVQTVCEAAFREAAQRLEALGGKRVPVDFEPFSRAAWLLYNSAFVADRYSSIRAFLEKPISRKGDVSRVINDTRLERVTAGVVGAAAEYSAADVYDASAELAGYKAVARVEFSKVDLLLVPTALQQYTVAEIEAEEKQAATCTWTRNTHLGRFTNFVNLMDMCAVSVPSALLRYPDLAAESNPSEEVKQRARVLEETGNPTPTLPFGVTLVGPAWTDEFLWDVGAKLHKASGLGCGPAGHGVRPYRTAS